MKNSSNNEWPRALSINKDKSHRHNLELYRLEKDVFLKIFIYLENAAVVGKERGGQRVRSGLSINMLTAANCCRAQLTKWTAGSCPELKWDSQSSEPSRYPRKRCFKCPITWIWKPAKHYHIFIMGSGICNKSIFKKYERLWIQTVSSFLKKEDKFNCRSELQKFPVISKLLFLNLGTIQL